MVSEWRRVSLNSRLLNLTLAISALCFIESDARELSDRCSCNFHLTTIGKTSSSIKESLSISMFRFRLWTRCLFTFTKLATSQSRCGVSSEDKASTTSRSGLTRKRVKPCTVSSPAVTVFSSAEDRLGRQSEAAAHIRTDLDCRTSEVAPSLVSRPCFTLFAAPDSDNAVRCAAKQKNRRGIPATAASR
jgi:hypothetical protein